MERGLISELDFSIFNLAKTDTTPVLINHKWAEQNSFLKLTVQGVSAEMDLAKKEVLKSNIVLVTC